jgi:hypothetical protein
MVRPSAHDATVVDMPSPAQGQQSYPSPPYGQRAQPEPGYGTPPQGQYAQGQQPYGTLPQGQYAQGQQPYGTLPQGQYAQGQPSAADQRGAAPPARRSKLPLVLGIGALLLLLAVGGGVVRNRLRANNRATPQPTRVSGLVTVPTLDDILVPTDEGQPKPSPDEPPTPEPTREPATLPEGWAFRELRGRGMRLAVPPDWELKEDDASKLLTLQAPNTGQPIRTTVQLGAQLVSGAVDLEAYRELVKKGMADQNMSFELLAPVEQTVRGLEAKGLSYTLLQKPEGQADDVAIAVVQYFFQHQGQRATRVFTMTCFMNPVSVDTEQQHCEDILASIDFLE